MIAVLAKKPIAQSISATWSRFLSTPSFAELFRQSVDSAPVTPGDVLHGHVVGGFQPRSTSSRFYVVDFGLKEEAVLTGREVPETKSIGDSVTMPLITLEDDFNEPVFDHDRRTQFSAIQAERCRLLIRHTSTSNTSLLYGRFSGFNRGGASVKILGTDAFVPRHHVLALKRPVLGTFSPFYLLSLSAEKPSNNAQGLGLYPVVSSYGGVLLCLANLVGFDSAWKGSGGGSAEQRLAYLRLLTRILQQKNPAVRRILPKGNYERTPRRNSKSHFNRPSKFSHDEVAWLNELPRNSWNSSGKNPESMSIVRQSQYNTPRSNRRRRNIPKQQRRTLNHPHTSSRGNATGH